MSAYVDTSVLAAYYLPEASSRKVEAILGSIDGASISALVEVEFASVVARKVRTRALDRKAGAEALALFHGHRAAGLYRMAVLADAHYVQARRWIESLAAPLRTLDALHLAVAHGHSIPLLTADRQLARAARKLAVRIRLLTA